MKKLVALFLALSMLLCLAPTALASEEIDTSEHVKIIYMTTGDVPSRLIYQEEMLEKVNALLTEKVNAEIEIFWIEWTDYLTNYNLKLATGMAGSGDTIDLVVTATDWLDAWPNVKREAFLPLSEEMLSTYAPMTWEQVSPEHWDMCRFDGDIYLIPEDRYAQWINHGFMYRNDWALEAGLENGVNSWEELGQYFAGIKENHPDVIPWDSNGSQYTQTSAGYFISNLPVRAIDGLQVPIFFGASKDDMYTLVSPYMEGDELLDFAKLMKEWSDGGYWREDVLNNKDVQTRDLMYQGKTGSDQHHTETWYGTVRPYMDREQPGSEVGFFYFGKENQNLTAMSITHGAMAISSFSANPERALMVYDLLRNDEEIYRLFNYGIEGKSYIIDENGYLDQPEGFSRETDAIQTNYWGGRNDDLELLNAARYNEGYIPLKEEYNSFAIDYPYGQLIFDTESISAQLSNLSSVYTEYMPRIAFGKFDDAEAFVAEFRQKMLDAGYQDVFDTLSQQLADFGEEVSK